MTVLRDLLIDSRDGEWGKGESFADSVEVSVIRGTDFARARLGEIGHIPIRHLGQKYVQRKSLLPDDIIIETAGGTKDQPTGRTVYLTDRLLNALERPAVCASFARFLRIDPNAASPKFIFWLLQDLYERRVILKYNTQHTGVARFQFTTFADTFDLQLPERDRQESIASTLSAYDDLIEVNQRRIAILGEIARRLFGEWFVHFRYPGHESGELVETELGVAPNGWKPGIVADISQLISRGVAPEYDDTAAGTVINQKCIRGQCLSLEQARRQAKFVPVEKLLQRADVLINSTGVGTLGRTAQVMGDLPATTVDSHVSIVRAAKGVDVHFFGMQLLTLEPYFERQGIGSTGQTELSRKAIADAPLLVPPNELTERFGHIVGPMREQSETLRRQNTRLRTARDLLLPKLISGEIEFKRAEAAFAVAAE
jgi:type I restriction enzyme, S subunit